MKTDLIWFGLKYFSSWLSSGNTYHRETPLFQVLTALFSIQSVFFFLSLEHLTNVSRVPKRQPEENRKQVVSVLAA